MQVELGIVIAIASMAFSAGIAVGMFSLRFVARSECARTRETVWARIDAIQDALTGGSYTFEVRLVPKRQPDDQTGGR